MPVKNRTATGVLGGLVGLVGLSAVAGLLITVTVTPALAVSGAAASSAISLFDNMPRMLEIDKLMLPTTIYYKNAETGQDTVMTKFYDQNRSPVTFDQVAPVMYDAILSSEDPRFYQHGGIDLIGTTRAILSNAKGGETQGGSSISQQYVKNILVQRCYSTAKTTKDIAKCYKDATDSSGTDGIQRKLQEMRYAIQLEKQYSKNDILLGYLNIANFGGTTYGVDAAAHRYFGVSAAQLTLGQSATLAGIVQNPNTYRLDEPASSFNGAPNGVVEANNTQLAALVSLRNAGTITPAQFLAAADGYGATKGRQLYVLSRLLADGKITQTQYVAAAIEPIAPNITSPTTGCAATGGMAYFCQYVVSVIKNDPAFGASDDDREAALRRGGLNIYTTVDTRLQSAAEATLAKNAPATVNSNSWTYGSTITNVENSTGRVLSIAQNTKFTDEKTPAPGSTGIVYAGDKANASSGFAPGSTFKLFTLLNWLESGHSVNEVLNGNVRAIKRVTNSCEGDWVNIKNEKPLNFNKQSGFVGTPMQFTKASLNSGFFAMAEKLDMCNTAKDAAKLGVSNADGTPITMPVLNSVIGNTQAVSPLAMTGAFAAVANNGTWCQSKVIDRVTDSSGADLPVPVRTCSQRVDPAVAATAAYALQGVMTGGGTGSQGNPNDGTQLLGKTGTNEATSTWLIQASTAVTTAVWSGVADGQFINGNVNPAANVFKTYFNRNALSNVRYVMGKAVQRVADQNYPGGKFPAPDANLIKTVLTNLPNVVGMSVDRATKALTDAGFEVAVGDPVDSDLAAGTIAQQNPGAGRVAGGATVTISPSNGLGISVPDVGGQKPNDAVSNLRNVGFGNVLPGTCTVDAAGGDDGKVTSTTPGAGTMSNANMGIVVNYSRKKCP